MPLKPHRATQLQAFQSSNPIDMSWLSAELADFESRTEEAKTAQANAQIELAGTSILGQDAAYMQEVQNRYLPELAALQSGELSHGEMYKRSKALGRNMAVQMAPLKQRAMQRAKVRDEYSKQFKGDMLSSRVREWEEGLPGLVPGSENYGYMGTEQTRAWNAPVDIGTLVEKYTNAIDPEQFNLMVDSNGNFNKEAAIALVGEEAVDDALKSSGVHGGLQGQQAIKVNAKVVTENIIRAVANRALAANPEAAGFLADEMELALKYDEGLPREFEEQQAGNILSIQEAIENGTLSDEQGAALLERARTETVEDYARDKLTEPHIQNAVDMHARAQTTVTLQRERAESSSDGGGSKGPGLLMVPVSNLAVTEDATIGDVYSEIKDLGTGSSDQGNARRSYLQGNLDIYKAQATTYSGEMSAIFDQLSQELGIEVSELADQIDKDLEFSSTEDYVTGSQSLDMSMMTPSFMADDATAQTQAGITKGRSRTIASGMTVAQRNIYDSLVQKYKDGFANFDITRSGYAFKDHSKAKRDLRRDNLFGVEGMAKGALQPVQISEDAKDEFDVDSTEMHGAVMNFLGDADTRVIGYIPSGEHNDLTFKAANGSREVTFTISKSDANGLGAEILEGIVGSKKAAQHEMYYSDAMNKEMNATGQAVVPNSGGDVLTRSNFGGRPQVTITPSGSDKELTAKGIMSLKAITNPGPEESRAIDNILAAHMFQTIPTLSKSTSGKLTSEVINAYLLTQRMPSAAEDKEIRQILSILNTHDMETLLLAMDEPVHFTSRGPAAEYGKIARMYGRQ